MIRHSIQALLVYEVLSMIHFVFRADELVMLRSHLHGEAYPVPGGGGCSQRFEKGSTVRVPKCLNHTLKI